MIICSCNNYGYFAVSVEKCSRMCCHSRPTLERLLDLVLQRSLISLVFTNSCLANFPLDPRGLLTALHVHWFGEVMFQVIPQVFFS